jgi:PAS domain S-box-containing protein
MFALAAMIIIIILIWNRNLKRIVLSRTANLAESEARYRSVVEDSPVLICSFKQDGEITFANKAYCKYFDRSEEELIGTPIYALIPEEEHEIIKNNLSALNPKKSVQSHEYRVIGPGVQEKWQRWTNRAIFDQEDKLNIYQSFGEDITDRKKIQDALKKSEEELRNLMEQSPVSIQIHDPGGKLMKSNAAYARLFALNEDTLNELYEKYNVLEDEQAGRQGLTPYIKKVFEGEESKFPAFEYDGVDTLKTLGISNPVSRKCWLRTQGFPVKDENGNVTSAVFLSEDITEQKQSEKKIQESEEKYRELVEQAQDGITIIQYGEIRFVNPSLTKLIGYTIDELLDTPFTNYVHPDELKKVTDIYQRRINGKPAPSIYESVLLTKEGQPLEVEFNARVIQFSGKPADLVIVRNISERKRVEKKLALYQNRLKELAAQLTLVEEKERRRIATDLHDQIGQLLASTRFQLVAMKKNIDSTSLNKKIEDISANLRQAIEYTRHIISDLSSPLLSELGFSAAISEWLEENIQNRFEIETSFRCNTTAVELKEDVALLLFRSMRELVTNVIKHAQASKVEVIINVKENQLYLIVRDNGIGLKNDLKSQLSNGAEGLGLFSIRERMSDLGGEMKLKYSKSKGTEVTLTVPIGNR